MLTIDTADIGYRWFTLTASLFAIAATFMAIVGFWFEPTPRNESTRYQLYSYLFISVDILMAEITYAIPFSSINFSGHTTLCIANGWIQYITENFTKFFTIGMSMFMLLTVSPKYRRCQCRGRTTFGLQVFLFWTISGAIYTGIFTVLGAVNGIMGVRENRCWVDGAVGNMSTYMYQFVSYRILGFVTTAIAVIYAILCSLEFKRLAREHKDIYLVAEFVDEIGYKDAVEGIHKLNRSLFHKFIGFVIVGVIGVVFSNSLDYIFNGTFSPTIIGTCFGWVDLVLVVIYFTTGFIFSNRFVVALVRKIGDTFGKHDE